MWHKQKSVKVKTPDGYKFISKNHKDLMDDLNLVLEFMEFEDWEDLIKHIKREIKIKKILNNYEYR